MKKIGFLLFLFLFPVFVHASNRYDIENLLIDARVLENGDMDVQELFIIDGNIETFHKNIYYRNSRLSKKEEYDFSHDAIHNGSSLQKIAVKVKKITKKEEINFDLFQQEFQDFSKIYYEEDKEQEKYLESSMQDGKRLKLFYQGIGEKVAFLFQYTITDVAVKHQDIAEIYWTFVDSEFQNDIEDLKIRVTIPSIGQESLKMAWIHGDLTSKVFIEENVYLATMKNIAKETAINMRFIFDEKVLNEIKKDKTTNFLGYQKIVNLEKKKRVEEYELEKKKEKAIRIIESICKILIPLMIIWWIYVYFKYGKEPKSQFQEKYYQKAICDYNIEVAGTFLKGEVTKKEFIASFLNLIYKKNIKISFWKKNGNDEFILENRHHMNHTEEILADILFERVGSKNKFTLEDLKNYLQNATTLKVFQKHYLNWMNCVSKDVQREEFYEQNGKPIISSIFLLLLSFFLLFANIYFGVSLVSPWLVFFISVLFFFSCSFMKRKTKKGVEDEAKWKSYKNFLAEKNDENNDLHLVYRVIFGLDKTKFPKKSIFKNQHFYESLIEEMERLLENLYE